MHGTQGSNHYREQVDDEIHPHKHTDWNQRLARGRPFAPLLKG